MSVVGVVNMTPSIFGCSPQINVPILLMLVERDAIDQGDDDGLCYELC